MKHSLGEKKHFFTWDHLDLHKGGKKRDDKIETPKSDPKRIKPSKLETNGTKSLSKTLPSNQVLTKPVFQSLYLNLNHGQSMKWNVLPLE